MYANRYDTGPRFRPASLGVALAINGGVVAALLLAAPEIVPRIVPDGIDIVDIKLPPEPTPTPEPQQRQAKPQPQPSAPAVTPQRKVDVQQETQNGLTGEPDIGTLPGTGEGVIAKPLEPPAPPLFVGVRDDPRYRGGFQPPYPDFERDAGREDVVRLRVLVGIDGRVKQVVRLDGRDSFVRAATAHALAKWRFLPATRGGVPEESWRTMTVRFQLDA